MTRVSRSGGAGRRAIAAFQGPCGRAVEELERRVLLSTFTVTNTADSGLGSLRQAMLDANSHVGPDAIAFNIPGVGVQTIAPQSPLPAVSDTVTIDGTTQPGYSAAAGAPVIELDGAAAGPANGLVLGASTLGVTTASNSAVKALIINGFAKDGIVLQGTSDQVKGCYIGLNAAGDAAAPNRGNGITVGGGQAMIGGATTADRNVISGNALGGINDLTVGATITGNYIGTNAIGSAAVGNGHEGIRTTGPAVIGPPVIGASGTQGNVISGNGYSGIYCAGQGLVQIIGNYIGTDASGEIAVGNGASPAAPYRDGITLSAVGGQIGGIPVIGAKPLGNVISGNAGAGINISSTSAAQLQITGNLIGTSATGSAALGNQGDGILVAEPNLTIGATRDALANGASILTTGGNVISGNGHDGILVRSVDTAIRQNYIGTDLTGTHAIPNAANGIELQSAGNNVGLGLFGRNVISGNRGNGVLIDPVNTTQGSNTIMGNLIGTDVSGNAALGNLGNGVLIIGSIGNRITAASGVVQVISGNGGAGISLRVAGSPQSTGGNTTVTGNYIGTNSAGNAPLGNKGNGIEVFENNDTIGLPGAADLISANGGSGVYLGEVLGTPATQQNRILSNLIGTDASGKLAPGMGNAGDGITTFRSNNNSIGGPSAPAGNTIAGNGGNGVTVDAGAFPLGSDLTAAVHNRISGNSIFANGGLGIDLGNDGVTPNHSNPQTPGPNFFENFPVILSAVSEPSNTVVRFQVGTPSLVTTIEFFANDAADPSGFGEGQRFVLSQTVQGSAGTALLPTLPVGTILSATATDSGGDTSEFSQDVTVIAPPPTVTHSAFDPQTNTISFTFSKDVSASLSPSALRVHNQTTGQDVAATGVSYDPASNTATFQLPGNLPGGSYVVTLLARAVTDSAGVHLDGNGDGTPGDDYSFQFASVSGDVNLDGAVSFEDLIILARNFGSAGTFSDGDLNHDGSVDFADLLILAQAYGQHGATAAARTLR